MYEYSLLEAKGKPKSARTNGGATILAHRHILAMTSYQCHRLVHIVHCESRLTVNMDGDGEDRVAGK